MYCLSYLITLWTAIDDVGCVYEILSSTALQNLRLWDPTVYILIYTVFYTYI